MAELRNTEMGRVCEQCYCPELALLPPRHWVRSPLSKLNMRISMLWSVLWPDLASLFQVSSGVNLAFV